MVLSGGSGGWGGLGEMRAAWTRCGARAEVSSVAIARAAEVRGSIWRLVGGPEYPGQGLLPGSSPVLSLYV